MILVDTSILSLAFRRKRRDLSPAELPLVYALQRLLEQGLVCLIGPIRQEILSGISSETHFFLLKSRLAAIEDLPLDSDAFVLAAEFYNRCRGQGVAPGDIDMMICAAARLHACDIFTADPDFLHYARLLPIRLFQP